jgi:leader peptidase (prepilin peptidase) / N-methyltransferase
LIPFFLCWGSFLNVVAYRLVHDIPFFAPRSQCPHCAHQIAWYDNIPVLSFFLLQRKCRSCSSPISPLYPFIELITALSLSFLFIFPLEWAISYGIFFSALIVSIRTDLETMLISRYVSLALIPCAFVASYVHWLPINITQSVLGAASSYLFLYGINAVYLLLRKQIGIGLGDIELLSFIGACIGLQGWWFTLLLASCFGSLAGISIMLYKRSFESFKIPFGPFLAIGAMTFVILEPHIMHLFAY